MVPSLTQKNGYCIALTTVLIYLSCNIQSVLSFSSPGSSTIRSFSFENVSTGTRTVTVLPTLTTTNRCSSTLHVSSSRREKDDSSFEADSSKKKKNCTIQGGNKKRSIIQSIWKPVSLSLLTASVLTTTRHGGGFLANNPLKIIPPPAAHASAPLPALPKFKPPTLEDGLRKAREERDNRKGVDAMNHNIKCDTIEDEEGKEARVAYEARYKAALEKRAEASAIQRKKLLYGLADQGMCPFVDREGVRQLFLLDEEIDLSKVPGTPQQSEILDLLRNKKLASMREKQRFIIKCIVDDLKLKGEDPVAYLEANKDKTYDLLQLGERTLTTMELKYKEIIALRGSLSGVKADTPFDTAVAILGVQDSAKMTKEAKIAKKAEAARLKTQAKEAKMEKKLAAKVEAARIKAEAKAAKAKAKEDANTVEDKNVVEVTEEVAATEVVEASDLEETTSETTDKVSSKVKSTARRLPIRPAVAVLGGGVTFKVLQNRAVKAENERLKQFKMLMGEDDDDDDDDED